MKRLCLVPLALVLALGLIAALAGNTQAVAPSGDSVATALLKAANSTQASEAQATATTIKIDVAQIENTLVADTGQKAKMVAADTANAATLVSIRWNTATTKTTVMAAGRYAVTAKTSVATTTRAEPSFQAENIGGTNQRADAAEYTFIGDQASAPMRFAA